MARVLIKSIALCFISVVSAATMYAQTRVTGTVTDHNGEPVPGVTVMVKGTVNGTQTNFEGTWTLQVSNPENATIQFSCLGYDTVEEVIGNRAVVNVVMAESTEALDELVFVGYGTQRKVNLTGSVTAVNYDDIAENRTLVSVSASLAGLVPGMNVTQTSGHPGNESVSIRIRGNGSFTSDSNAPLVLVDGVECSMDYVNPNDIASISVLKDAASTAIYGTRGANGVILINTKNGVEGKARISYSFKGVWQSPYNPLEWVNDYADYMELMNESRYNLGMVNMFTQTSIDLWREKSKDPNGIAENGLPNYMVYPNTDWWDVLFRNSFSQEHNFELSGGTEKVRYLMSVGYLDNQGIMPKFEGVGSDTQKISFRANLDADVTKWFTAGMKLFGSRQDYGMARVSNVFNYTYILTPGTYGGTEYGTAIPALKSEEATNTGSPFGQFFNYAGYNKYTRINGTVYADIHPYKGISIEGSVNYSPTFREQHRYTNNWVSWDYTDNVKNSEKDLGDATAENTHAENYYLTTEVLAKYNATFKKEHELGVLFGYSTEEYYTWSWSASRLGGTDWSLNDLGTYESVNSVESSAKTGWGLRSYFGRVNYAFKDRYLFEVDFRADGSSRFGSNNRYGFFPAASAGWKIHEEPWMANSRGWLDELKLRVSWGQTGNNNGISNFAWQSTYATENVVLEGSPTTGLYINAISNADLKWETTSTTDVGVDVAFFRNRLTAEIDYYNKYTTDVLSTPSTYYTMGFASSVPQNLGTVVNNGVELALNWKSNAGKDFFYYVGVNASYNVNKVLKYKGKLERGWVDGEYVTNYEDVSTSFGNGRLLEGHPLGEHYLYQLYTGTGKGYSGSGAVDINAGPKDGMIRTETDFNWVQAMMDAGYTFVGNNSLAQDQLWYGDFIYADLNGDGNYGDSNDRDFTGYTDTPSVNLGISLGFSWKGLEFSMLWTGAFDYRIVWTGGRYNRSDTVYGNAIAKRVADDHYFYDPTNPNDSRTNINGKYPRMTYATGLDNTLTSNFYEYNGDYMKLKNVQIAYTLPEKWTRKFYVQQLKFFVSGENLITVTSFPGMDPEIGGTVYYPLMRQYTLGAQITF